MRKLTAVVVCVFMAACSGTDGGTKDQVPVSLPVEGTYQARIPAREFRALDYLPAARFGGPWTLTITEGTFVLEGGGFRVTEQWETRSDRFGVIATPAPTGAYNCHEDGKRLTGKDEASSTYGVDVGDETLRFAAQEEPCELRKLILERTWDESP